MNVGRQGAYIYESSVDRLFMRNVLGLFLVLFAAMPQAVAQEAARYRVLFESTWSAGTHPDGFPSNPHFSGLIGATHDASTVLWEPGGVASTGIEVMAETGAKGPLTSEVDVLIASGDAEHLLSGGGIGLSPGAVAIEFDVSSAFSHVSLVSMLAPSPDWFVGVDALDLYAGGAWASEVDTALYVYDAGTDSGTEYTSPDQDTNPSEAIARIEEPPFRVGGMLRPVGRFVFTRVDATAVDDEIEAKGFELDMPTPNPSRGRTAVRLRVDQAQSVRVEVFDIRGRRVEVIREGFVTTGSHRLEVKGLAPGVYVVRAQGEKRSVMQRLVVVR